MKKNIIILIFFVFVGRLIAQQPLHQHSVNQLDYQPHTVIIKLKENSSNLRVTKTPLQEISEHVKVKDISLVFTGVKNGRYAESKSGLERIFKVQLEDSENVIQAIRKLQRTGLVEYAEPLFENQLLYTPNDPEANPTSGGQFHLTNINAYSAWSLEKGDTNIVVGIVDTGVDIDHPDLQPNIAFNHDDPVNGTDDDGDGFIDNYMGWDIADNDSDPNSDTNVHGSKVSGVSSAKTDNSVGLAGVGFRTRFLPIKILENASGSLKNEYEGVLYAANQGCQVINLSWGGPWNFTQFGQDIVNYAVLDRDAVVISASGNTSGEIDFYPASYENVLSVTASDDSDNFTNWATYSYHVDLMAPGHGIFSANNNGGYVGGSVGTSFAAPMVAGAAALVRSRYPNWDARQVMEQLRVSSKDVYDVGNNNDYFGQIGKGKLDIAKALADTTSPSLRISELNFSGRYGDYIFPEDTIYFTPSFINYLTEAKNLQIEIISADGNTNSNPLFISKANVATYETISSEENWQVILGQDLEPYSRLLFRADLTGENYEDFEFFQTRTTPWFFDVESNQLSMTISGDGDLGYDRDSLLWGNGIWFDTENLADQMGIIVSRGDFYVANNVIRSYDSLARDQDFIVEEHARMFSNSTASLDARSVFTENDEINKQGLVFEQKILGWDDMPDNDFFVVEYRIVNTSDSTLDDINISMYTDWDIQNAVGNTLEYDQASGISYAFDPFQNDLFAGISLLTSGDTALYAIDRASENGHTADFQNAFSDSLKLVYSQSDFLKTTAGNLPGGNDVASIHGLRNIVLAAGESKKIALVVMGGNSFGQLVELQSRAKNYYNEYLNSPPLENIFYACEGGSATIQFEDDLPFEIYSDASLNNLLDSGQVYNTSPFLEDTLFYTVNIVDGLRKDVRTSKVEIRKPLADFEMYTDTLSIAEESLDTITFFNKSDDAFYFEWDFDNGFFSTNESPTAQYNSPDSYQVRLKIENDIGCQDSVVIPLVVVERTEKPAVSHQTICKGNSATIQASNTNLIHVYDSPDLDNRIFTGDVFVTDNLQTNASFYVTNADGYESLSAEVEITVSHPQLDLIYSIDTLDLENKYMLKIENTSSYGQSYSWTIDGASYQDNVIDFNYEGLAQFDIVLHGQDSMSCNDSLVVNVMPMMSPDVLVNDTSLCINEIFTIKPSGGDLFYFYSDEALNNLIHKGRVFRTGPLKSDTSFYITNMDGLLEGNESAANISLKPLKAAIRITPETLDLSEGNTVLVENVSEDATSAFWLWPTGSIDTRNSFEWVVDQPGEYAFTLIAEGGENCKDTARAIATAHFVTGMPDEIEGVKIYPNPVGKVLNIDAASFKWDNFKLIDHLGRDVLINQNVENYTPSLEIDISHLTNGIYLLRLQGKDKTIISKIIVSH